MPRFRIDKLFLTVFLVPLDFAALLVAGVLAWLLRFSAPVQQVRPVAFAVTFSEYFALVVAVSAFTIVMLAIAGLYQFPRSNIGSLGLSLRIILASFGTLAAIALVVFFRQELFGSRFLVLAGWVIAVVILIVERGVFALAERWLARRYGFGVRRAVVIGSDQTTDRFVSALRHDPTVGFQVIKKLNEPNMEEVGSATALLGIEAIIFADPNFSRDRVVPIIEFAHEQHIAILFIPNLFQALTANTSVSLIEDLPLVELKRTALDGWGRVWKRGVDIVGAFFALLIFVLPMAAIGLAIKLDDTRGPVLYRNRRAGQFGKEFNVIKFRSMGWKYATGPGAPNPEQAIAYERELAATQSIRRGPVWKILNDPRRTRIGRFLERMSLDELPQFFNVLRGDMSLVGPRPHMLEQVTAYEKAHKRVFAIRPGITGLTQISGRSDLDFEDEVRLDTHYLEHWSPWLDFKVMLKTPFVVLFRKHRS